MPLCGRSVTEDVLPHLKMECRAGWVIMNPIGGEFHETVGPAFLRVAEGSDRPSPHQRQRTCVAPASSTIGSTVTAESTNTTARSPATGGSRTGKNEPLSISTTVILSKGIATRPSAYGQRRRLRSMRLDVEFHRMWTITTTRDCMRAGLYDTGRQADRAGERDLRRTRPQAGGGA